MWKNVRSIIRVQALGAKIYRHTNSSTVVIEYRNIACLIVTTSFRTIASLERAVFISRPQLTVSTVTTRIRGTTLCSGLTPSPQRIILTSPRVTSQLQRRDHVAHTTATLTHSRRRLLAAAARPALRTAALWLAHWQGRLCRPTPLGG